MLQIREGTGGEGGDRPESSIFVAPLNPGTCAFKNLRNQRL